MEREADRLHTLTCALVEVRGLKSSNLLTLTEAKKKVLARINWVLMASSKCVSKANFILGVSAVFLKQ